MNNEYKTIIIMSILTIVVTACIVLFVLMTYDPNPVLIGRDVMNDCTDMAYTVGECIIK